jgi:uncharacterized protein (DUF111 family)
LFAAGALDVQIWATQMKKGRTGFRVEVTAAAGDAARVTEALFVHSTTAGVRRQAATRVTLPRRELRVPASDGSAVRVKVLDGPGGPRLKPEYDDVERVARNVGRPAHEVARELHERATRLVGASDGPKAPPPNEES